MSFVFKKCLIMNKKFLTPPNPQIPQSKHPKQPHDNVLFLISAPVYDQDTTQIAEYNGGTHEHVYYCRKFAEGL